MLRITGDIRFLVGGVSKTKIRSAAFKGCGLKGKVSAALMSDDLDTDVLTIALKPSWVWRRRSPSVPIDFGIASKTYPARMKAPQVMDIGGGLERTAYYAKPVRFLIYLPTTSVAQAYFLGRTLGNAAVSLKTRTLRSP
ncbi:hypothetical protein RFM26_24755 [Mesorhizobium sp. VK23B]|uniref:Uncharacterized protein n=1 Tax=Mesorhizobium dulcispinae TaxID=3072316 RepID=A0ABU4XKL9_9HYPH|nr:MULTISPECIES: hypothetical protein [unclassified Mesorhizobium]MDX8468924.1 hypothetical protein [Mesorhizobium sp. VK23B]MDX8475287.1 hypothetical protein [Mesorhizobium sp. VK23A]